jgi:hypothetical protein
LCGGSFRDIAHHVNRCLDLQQEERDANMALRLSQRYNSPSPGPSPPPALAVAPVPAKNDSIELHLSSPDPAAPSPAPKRKRAEAKANSNLIDTLSSSSPRPSARSDLVGELENIDTGVCRMDSRDKEHSAPLRGSGGPSVALAKEFEARKQRSQEDLQEDDLEDTDEDTELESDATDSEEESDGTSLSLMERIAKAKAGRKGGGAVDSGPSRRRARGVLRRLHSNK